MITVTLLSDGRVERGDLALLERPGVHWIDVEAPTPQTLEPLVRRFGLHPLAIEDVLHLNQRPKLEEYPGHQFLVLHGFTRGEQVWELTRHELHFFISERWVITAHDRPLPFLDEVRRRIEADASTVQSRGADFLAYLLADALVDSTFPLLDGIDDSLETLEDRIFGGARQTQLEEIFALKRALVQLRRTLSPQRDVVLLLSRRGMTYVSDRTTLYFRDVYDHLSRLAEQIDSARDLLGNTVDAYLSMVANRTNDITKQLTLIATIFLPLSFITGFFGQNFPELQRPQDYWLMLLSMVSVPVGLVIWFRRKRWL